MGRYRVELGKATERHTPRDRSRMVQVFLLPSDRAAVLGMHV